MLNRIKVGDMVEVISGKDKFARGEVLEIDRTEQQVRVRGIAVVTRCRKPKTRGGKGSLEKTESFINISKVMPICPQTNKACRVRAMVLADGKKVRVSSKSGAQI